MPRPKGEPTKVVRLPVALLAPFEAEAKSTGRKLTDVLAARLNGRAVKAAPPDETPRPSPAGRKAKTEVATRPARSAATARQGASRPVASPRRVDPAAMARQAKMNAAKSGKR